MPSYVPYLTDRERRQRPKVLIILHQEASTPGRIGYSLVERGFDLDIRKPRFGDALPDTMENHAGAVIFGGPMSANETDNYVKEEIDWLDVPLREEAPFLGVCLGAQMLARNLGAKVCEHPEKEAEIGYYRIHPTSEGRALMDWPSHVYQWHREGSELPAGSTLLATNNLYPCQAFRTGPCAYGIQFHPEVNFAMMNRWSIKGAPRMSLPGAQQRRQHFDGRALYDGGVRSWLIDFLDIWIGTAQKTVPDENT